MLKMLGKQVLKILDTKIKLITAVIVLLCIFSIAAISGYQITSVGLASFLQGGDTRSITLLTISMYLNASLLTFIFFILFKSVTSDQDWLSAQLSWFPVTLFEKNLGYFIPFIGVVLLLVYFAMSIILVPAFIMQHVGLGFGTAFFFGLLLQTVFILCLIQLLYNIVHFFVSLCKLPFGKFFTLFLVILACIVYGLATFSIQSMIGAFITFDYNIAYFVSPLFLQIVGELSHMKVNILLVLGIYIITVLLSFFSLFLIRIRSEKRSPKLLRFIPMPSNKMSALIVKEIKTQCRNEENLLNFFLIAVFVLLLKLKFNFTGGTILVLTLAGITGMIALNSFGNDKKMFLAYKIYDIHSSAIAVAKYIGVCILAFIQFILFCTLILYIPSVNDIWTIIIVVINSTAVFYLNGTIIPLDKNNPYTGILSFSILICILIPITFVANYTMGHATEIVRTGVIIIAELFLAAAIVLSNKWRYRNE